MWYSILGTRGVHEALVLLDIIDILIPPRGIYA